MYEGSSQYELIFIIIEVDSGSLYTHTHTHAAAGYKLYQTLSQHTHTTVDIMIQQLRGYVL